MKRFLLVGMLWGGWGFSHEAGAADPKTLLAPSQKVLVWAQAKDPGFEQAVEFNLQAMLADRRIISERYSKVFPPESDPRKRLFTLRELSFRALIVLHPAGNIQELKDNVAPDKVSGSALERFLEEPPGELRPVALAPASSLGSQAPGVTAPARGPVPGNQGPSARQLIKVGAIVFDVAAGELAWKGKFPVRASPDLPLASYQQRIVEGAIGALDKEGLLPPRR
jgi:hypothetical protein